MHLFIYIYDFTWDKCSFSVKQQSLTQMLKVSMNKKTKNDGMDYKEYFCICFMG